eukprot:CAMPEP_0179213022 /NCGR_PEP_ID=MMETSP0797-20121207/1442_1 /TAXON_ID=47934 /ORGANISM="Dinophysis acuminata, Strain DAEP01" /LENGTH=43 /DNA_ID= /DNA_START= /DNA_END= /DNA_ORIENTATION=
MTLYVACQALPRSDDEMAAQNYRQRSDAVPKRATFFGLVLDQV